MAHNPGYYQQQQQQQQQPQQPQQPPVQYYQPQNIYQQLGQPQPQPHLQAHPSYAVSYPYQHPPNNQSQSPSPYYYHPQQVYNPPLQAPHSPLTVVDPRASVIYPPRSPNPTPGPPIAPSALLAQQVQVQHTAPPTQPHARRPLPQPSSKPPTLPNATVGNTNSSQRLPTSTRPFSIAVDTSQKTLEKPATKTPSPTRGRPLPASPAAATSAPTVKRVTVDLGRFPTVSGTTAAPAPAPASVPSSGFSNASSIQNNRARSPDKVIASSQQSRESTASPTKSVVNSNGLSRTITQASRRASPPRFVSGSTSNSPVKEEVAKPWSKLDSGVSSKATNANSNPTLSTVAPTTTSQTFSTSTSPPKKFVPIWKRTIPDYPTPVFGYAAGMVSDPFAKPETTKNPSTKIPTSAPAPAPATGRPLEGAVRMTGMKGNGRMQRGHSRTPASYSRDDDQDEEEEEEEEESGISSEERDSDNEDAYDGYVREEAKPSAYRKTKPSRQTVGRKNQYEYDVREREREREVVRNEGGRARARSVFDSEREARVKKGGTSYSSEYGRGERDRENLEWKERRITYSSPEKHERERRKSQAEPEPRRKNLNTMARARYSPPKGERRPLYGNEFSDDDEFPRKSLRKAVRPQSSPQYRIRDLPMRGRYDDDEEDGYDREGQYQDGEDDDEDEDEDYDRRRRPYYSKPNTNPNPPLHSKLRTGLPNPPTMSRTQSNTTQFRRRVERLRDREQEEEEERLEREREEQLESERGRIQRFSVVRVGENANNARSRNIINIRSRSIGPERIDANSTAWPADLPRLPRTPGSASADELRPGAGGGGYFDIRPSGGNNTTSRSGSAFPTPNLRRGLSALDLDDPPPRSVSPVISARRSGQGMERRALSMYGDEERVNDGGRGGNRPRSEISGREQNEEGGVLRRFERRQDVFGNREQEREQQMHSSQRRFSPERQQPERFSPQREVQNQQQQMHFAQPNRSPFSNSPRQLPMVFNNNNTNPPHQTPASFTNSPRQVPMSFATPPPAPPTMVIESPAPVGGRDKMADIQRMEGEGMQDDSHNRHSHQQHNHQRARSRGTNPNDFNRPNSSHSEVPQININSPRIQVDSPRINVEPPQINVEAPRISVDPPRINVDPPLINVDHQGTPRTRNRDVQPQQSQTQTPRVQVFEIPGISVASAEDSSRDDQHQHSEVQRQNQGLRGNPRPVARGGLICGGCHGPIVGRIVSAMGARWHPSCFRCTECDELLEHVSSYEHEGRPYCHLDYHENFAPRCYSCKTAIVEERFISLDDPALGKRAYHEQHFFCAECGDPFLSPSSSFGGNGELALSGDGEFEGFTVYKGHPYCEACHVRLRFPKCKRCKRSLRDGDQAVEALGGKWCWGCFLCTGCEKPFEDPSFFQRGNQPFCEKCFSILLRNEV